MCSLVLPFWGTCLTCSASTAKPMMNFDIPSVPQQPWLILLLIACIGKTKWSAKNICLDGYCWKRGGGGLRSHVHYSGNGRKAQIPPALLCFRPWNKMAPSSLNAECSVTFLLKQYVQLTQELGSMAAFAKGQQLTHYLCFCRYKNATFTPTVWPLALSCNYAAFGKFNNLLGNDFIY